jgi:two-component system sensor histidine kinase VanS
MNRQTMKSSYGKLMRIILAQTLLITVAIGLVGYGILTLLADRVFPDFFAELQTGGKTLFFVAGLCLLFAVYFYLLLRRMVRYLNEISRELEHVLSDSGEPVMLPPELEMMAQELSELKVRLARRKQEAAESEKRKNELVVYLAHDLKTPLTSVIAYLAMLDEHPDMAREDRVRYTHITMEKALRLGELINEFFEITRFNLQDIVLERERLDLSILLEQLADESYGMLGEKKMTCAVDVEDDLIIYGDPDKLARVFDNLLRNAAAYSYEGTEILIQARRGESRITIVFTNSGPQIPPQKLDMIFEKFYRVDDARSSQTGGSGLGLAIARQIVELHGGVITATSDSQHTRFIVSLPLGQTEQMAAPEKCV